MAKSIDKEVEGYHGFIRFFFKSMVNYLIILISDNIFLYIL